MTLSFRQKQSFYEHLAQLLRAGITFPGAVEKLSHSARGAQRRMLNELRNLLGSGKTVTEAFGALRPAVSEMEYTAVSALERSGRMDRGCQHLAEYFGAMDNARREILRRSAYPLVVLHLAVFVSKLPTLLQESSVNVYLRQTGFILFCLYGIFIILALLIPLLRDAGAKSATLDWVMQRIPLAGRIRRSYALARFCATYDMQLEAGVNVMDSLEAAGRASRSGLISDAVNRAVPELRHGAQVGPQLAKSNAFPESFTRTFLVAEETGELDRALARLTTQYQADGLAALTTFADWVPRLVYMALAAYAGWSIVSFYRDYMTTVMRQIDSI